MIAIQKLNIITINRFQNLQLNVLLDKWQFDTSQDWEVLRDNFNNVSSNTILGNILQTLSFYLFPLDYHEERAPQCVDVTNNPDLKIEEVDNG